MTRIISILFLALCFASCYSPRYVYSPSAQNIPLLNKKNDYKLAAYYSGGSGLVKYNNNYARGFDVQSVYALSSHFAIMVNEYLRWEKNGNNDFYPADSTTIKYKRSLTEFGLGYFTNLNRDKNLKFQLFGGSAFGRSTINDNTIINGATIKKFHQSNITKFFVQPAIIYNKTINFSAALSSRFSAIIFSDIKTDYSKVELNNYLLDSLTRSAIFFWEPAMSYTFGFKKLHNIKFEVQAAFSVLINKRFVDYRSSNFALGVIANFANHNKKSSSSKN